MPKLRLTQPFAQQACCPAGTRKIDFFDTLISGFMLEVRSSGGKTFYVRYRDARGREHQFKIGPAHVLKVTQARHKAKSILAQSLLGADPHTERRELRSIPTLAQFVRDDYLPFAKNAKRSWRTDETILRIHIIPVLGRQPLDLISNRAIAELLSTMQTKGYSPGTTNRVLVLLRFIFNLARKWGEYHLPENPTLGLKTAPDVSRSRFLSHEEARRLIAALEADENVTAAKAIRLLMLTGARRNEVTHAKWAHVDWTNGTLLVPRSKSGKPRHIVLNSAAIGLLKSIPAVPDNDFIFPSPATGRPSPSLHFPWKRIREAAQLEDVRLHDLRHSFASFLVNEGVSLYVVQKLLGHTHAHTTQRYAHLARATLNEAAEVVGRQLDRCRASVELA